MSNKSVFNSLVDINIEYNQLKELDIDEDKVKINLNYMCIDLQLPPYLVDVLFGTISLFDATLICISQGIFATDFTKIPTNDDANFVLKDLTYIVLYSRYESPFINFDVTALINFSIVVLSGDETPENFSKKNTDIVVWGYYDITGRLVYEQN